MLGQCGGGAYLRGSIPEAELRFGFRHCPQRWCRRLIRHAHAVADVPVRPGLTIPDRALTWRFSRSSGPGGQSVNTSDSRAELRFDLRELPEPFRTRALTRLAD